jgi:hypothetical protein
MDDETCQAVRRFLESFETVFGSDWSYTMEMLGIQEETPERAAAAKAMGLEAIPMISLGGTFLEPQIEDEVENWGNRAALLDSYRKLKRLFRKPE